MPAPHPQPRSWSTTMITIGILSAIIIFTFVAFFVYLRRRKPNKPSNNISDPEARRLSQVTGESERSNSQAETNTNRTQIGFKIVGRLPRLETINTPVRSVHPSVHNASPARSNFEPPLPTMGRRRSDPEERINTQVAIEGRRSHFFERDRQRRKHFVGQSLDSRINQNPSLEPPTIIELPRASLESNEPTDKNSHSLYSPFNEQGGSMRSLLEMSPSKYDIFPPSADSPTGFNLPTPNNPSQPQPIDRSPDFRITPASIVETTEKTPPARILRKKLLNLISTQPRPGLGNESEDKYYWEMMQVETNETWWQLPFPPQLSPIKPEFELSDLDFQPQPESPGPLSHTGNGIYNSHPQGIELASLGTT
ncbi:hypothetical protein PTTG_28651 [Puccinia triticina 1-1 BBBD Race 1]|uniref:Uncharacterized protein n=2 Tax=Puccinia triticina TaxID=208348 RepID=A0A180GAP4_PUCT1|nr:uncharacterized protein PtA15_3A877 [Puccinia triticina]OAV89518.1 hypothetical protein PTTG_28651 [Puccinia triticina 1-1 BBBD Race 1]WAQ83506.1 hypothetical protein PtA15_3A877 [Puccinia triticina]WAR54344.1 hypothetical protein PtB15_3B858 [Puccinia triticina]